MRRKLPLLFGAAFFALAIGACEGPEGPAGPQGPQGDQGAQGPAGAPGENALNTCSDCHSSDATIVAVETQLEAGVHGEEWPFYEDRDPCSACHSHNGLALWAENGTMPGATEFADVEFWAPINCRTCHQIHETFTDADFALTQFADVTLLLTGETVDFTTTPSEGVTLDGNNLCATCHQGRIRDPWPDPEAPVTQMFSITSEHFDAHHGPQANVLSGQVGLNIPGTFTIPTTPMTHGEEMGCTGCHMNYDFDSMELQPNHETFMPVVETCQQCHATAVDFDYHGVQTTVQGLLDDLETCLVIVGVAATDIDTGETHPVIGDHPEPYAAAYVNWAAFTEDGSRGVHNPDYALTVLGNSLELLQDNSAECATATATP